MSALITKAGLHTFDKPMTREQARRYGERNMPRDLRKAGFEVFVAETDIELHGWHGYRINYGKKIS